MPDIRMPLRELSEAEKKNRIKMTGWNAENKLYVAIQQFLGPEWIVWMNPELNLEGFNGEADCILYHNSYGMLIIETKGGKLSCEKKQWMQGGRPMDKSPLEQVRMNMRAMLNFVPDRIRIAVAVCLPDMSDRKDIAPMAASDLDLILKDSLTMDMFESKLIAILTQSKIRFGNQAVKHVPLEKPERKALYEKLSGKGSVSPKSIWDAQSRARESVRNFMRVMMESYHENRHMMFCGVAGSGKTKMAEWEMDVFLSEKKRVAYACYNVLLGEHVNYRYRNRKLEIREFYGWADYIAKVLGIKAPQRSEGEDANEYYSLTLMRFMEENVDKLPEEAKFDVLFIDEGQDLSPEKFDVLVQLLSKDGCLRFMYDEMQTIFAFEKNSEVVEHVLSIYPHITRINLNRTYRNTKAIVEWVNDCCGMGLKAFEDMPEGEQVQEIYYKDEENLKKQLQVKVSELKKKDIEPREIMIVSLAGFRNSGLVNADIDNCLVFPDKRDLSINKANIFSVFRIKGLESNCVFLIDNFKPAPGANRYEEKCRHERLMAVAATRARSVLYVFRPE